MLAAAIRRVETNWREEDELSSSDQWDWVLAVSLILLLAGSHLPRLGLLAAAPESLFDTQMRFPGGALAQLPALALITLSVLPVGLCAGLLLGQNRRRWGLLLAASIVLNNSIMYSLGGKIVHHQWIAISIGLMAWSGWTPSSRRALPARLVLVWIMGWGLSTSALSKVYGGWLSTDSSAVLHQLHVQSAGASSGGLFTNFATGLSASWVWELADYATVFLELALIPAALHPRVARWVISMLVVFHGGIFLFLGISFAPILVAYVPFFLPYMPAISLPERNSRRTRALVLVVCAVPAIMIARGLPDPGAWTLRSTIGTRPRTGSGVLLFLPVAALVYLGVAAARHVSRCQPQTTDRCPRCRCLRAPVLGYMSAQNPDSAA